MNDKGTIAMKCSNPGCVRQKHNKFGAYIVFIQISDGSEII